MQNQNWRFLNRVIVVATVTLLAVSFTTFAWAQESAGREIKGASPQAVSPRTPQAGYIYTPESSIERPEDLGLRAHTTYVVRSVDGNKPVGLVAPQSFQVSSSFSPDAIEEAETPASLGCLYVQSPNNVKTGCVPNYASKTKGPSSAGWGAIALVDAYDNPDAANDLKTFDTYWGLPAAKFVKVEATGNGDCSSVPANAGWSVEESLDIEWAPVFAPKAVIVLVEACSNSDTDLFYAESVAIQYIQDNYGGGDVSNSWAGGEFSSESSYDFTFAGANYSDYGAPVTVFASADDAGIGAAYPSSNPWLTSAGGTSVLRNSDGTFNSEGCWSGSGGGSSAYEKSGASTEFQYGIFGNGAPRATPDFAADADPASGAWIYNQYAYNGWAVVGGTSLSSPSLAGIVNRAGNKLSSWFGYYVDGYGYFTNGENNLLYAQLPTAKAYYTNFYDITTGSNGGTVTYNWDYCTGVGSPRGLLGK